MATAPNAVDTAKIPSASAQSGSSEGRLTRVLQLWHLLSFDAPSVAVLWTSFLARTNHIALPVTAVLAMGIAVWMLYAADRLLDARILQSTKPNELDQAGLEPRHYFHRHHKRGFRLGILSASFALALLLPSLAPQSIRLYLALGTLLFGYFVIIHMDSGTAQRKTHRLPKELAVGIFFSAATFIPTVARDPALRLALLPGAVLFAILCSLNCLFIYAWEHSAASSRAHPATRIALRFLPFLAIVAAIAGLLLSIADRSLPWPIPAACSVATLFLLLLHIHRRRFSPTTLRAGADLCLLTPLLLLHL